MALLQWNIPVSIDKCNRNHIAGHHFLQVFDHGHYARKKQEKKISQSVYNSGTCIRYWQIMETKQHVHWAHIICNQHQITTNGLHVWSETSICTIFLKLILIWVGELPSPGETAVLLEGNELRGAVPGAAVLDSEPVGQLFKVPTGWGGRGWLENKQESK